MSNDNSRPAHRSQFKRLLYYMLRFSVQCTGGFMEEDLG
uniref:Uncharacterized protein n=1 Tax=Arundo donax TaxID=35708 RepID=A0A0A9B8N6_ARUDO